MLMVGLSQEYLPKFAHDLGFSQQITALVVPAPMFAAAVLQQFTPWGVRQLGSHRRWVWMTAALQAASLLPLALLALGASWWVPLTQVLAMSSNSLVAFLGRWGPTGLLFVLVAGFWFGAMAGGAPWLTLVGRMIPSAILPRYLGRRTVLLQIALLLGLGLTWGAITLGSKAQGTTTWLGHDPLMFAWAGVFFVAMLFRAASVWFLSRYSKDDIPLPVPVSTGAFVSEIARSSKARGLRYLLLMQAAMLIAFPFFNPFMFDVLKVTPADYGLLLVAFFAGKMGAAELAGRAVHHWGLRTSIILASVLLVPVPVLWLVSSNWVWLLVVQFWSGAALSAFELCSVVLQVDHVPERERTTTLSRFSLAMQGAGMCGSSIGSTLLGASERWGSVAVFAAMFGLSSAARLMAAWLAWRLPPESEPTQEVIASQPAGGEGMTVQIEGSRAPSVGFLPNSPRAEG